MAGPLATSPADKHSLDDGVNLRHIDLLRVLLSHYAECYLSGVAPATQSGILLDSWDAWWLCHRLQLPAADLALDFSQVRTTCVRCEEYVRQLAVARPEYPTPDRISHCNCFSSWASQVREQSVERHLPTMRLWCCLVKPGEDAKPVVDLLTDSHNVLSRSTVQLEPSELRIVWAELFRAGYLEEHDRYLTSGPSQLLLLEQRDGPVEPLALKARIRHELGVRNPIINRVHMPDCSGEVIADLRLLGGGFDRLDLSAAVRPGFESRRTKYLQIVDQAIRVRRAWRRSDESAGQPDEF